MRAIILCAGDGKRWGGHLGRAKHLITIEGEMLAYRTTRLLRELGVDDVWVTSSGESPVIVPGTVNLHNARAVTNGELDRFYNGMRAWRTKGPLLYLYGDVYYTDQSIRMLVNANGDFRALGRRGESRLTGKPHGELFGFFVGKKRMAFEALEAVRVTYAQQLVERAAGWQWYRQVEGFSLDEDRVGERFMECDDWTEDFDCPNDYERWMARRSLRDRLEVATT